ncbi:MAG: DUF368 domain-containing protein [Syntrophomonadaceae bacterium]|nr:DUF368 domain-containing protein [Syntrophomonadaceae bacterium]
MNQVTPVIIRFLQGMIIGVGGIIPGVSGGVMAVLFGIYERFAALMAHPIKRLRQDFWYFLPIGIGGALGILLFARLVVWAFDTYQAETIYFFLGCILGTAPSLYRTATSRDGMRPLFLFIALLAFAIMTGVNLYFENTTGSMANGNLTVLFLISGVILGLGTMLPGLSAAAIMIYMGTYDLVMERIASVDFMGMLPVVLGFCITLLLLARFIHYLFCHFHGQVYFTIMGIVIASLAAIWPGWHGWLPVAVAAVGFILSRWLSKFDPNEPDLAHI